MPPILQTRERRVRRVQGVYDPKGESRDSPPSPPPSALARLCWGTGGSVLQEPLLVTAGRQVQPSGLGLPEACPQPLLLVSPVSSCTRGSQAGRAPAAGGGADRRRRATTLGPTPDPGRWGAVLAAGTGEEDAATVLCPQAGAAPVHECFLLRMCFLCPGIPGFQGKMCLTSALTYLCSLRPSWLNAPCSGGMNGKSRATESHNPVCKPGFNKGGTKQYIVTYD